MALKNLKIIGIAGGSCSGKTTLARAIFSFYGKSVCSLLYQDSYYLDQSHKFDRDGGAVNFDHPESIEFALLAEHLQNLRAGRSIEVPKYDFNTHKRQTSTVALQPCQILVVDGTLILSQPNVRQHFDFSFFIQCPQDLRFARRLHRDTHERGRTEKGVTDQFNLQVQPMHEQFVEPSQRFAKVILSQEEYLRGEDLVIKNHLRELI